MVSILVFSFTPVCNERKCNFFKKLDIKHSLNAYLNSFWGSDAAITWNSEIISKKFNTPGTLAREIMFRNWFLNWTVTCYGPRYHLYWELDRQQTSKWFFLEFLVTNEVLAPTPPPTNLVFPVGQVSIFSVEPFHRQRKPGHCHLTDIQLKLPPTNPTPRPYFGVSWTNTLLYPGSRGRW